MLKPAEKQQDLLYKKKGKFPECIFPVSFIPSDCGGKDQLVKM